MIWRDADGSWSITCGGCLARLPNRFGTREEIVAFLTSDEVAWEMIDGGDMCRCLACSRKAREVKGPATARGVLRPRRRRRAS